MRAHREGVLDRVLTRVSRIAPWTVGVADSYAGVLCRDASIRLRLVLLVAILENAPDFHRQFATSRESGHLSIGLAAARHAAGWLLHLAIATLIFGPLHLAELVRRATPGHG